MSTYAFGDGELAVERMRRLAEVFEGTSARFLAASVSAPVGLAVDLGCGPGHTTRLLAGTLRPDRTVGLDASARMVQVAAAAGGAPGRTLEFLRHDVTAVPFPVGPADLVYARFLMSHLSDPGTALAAWATQVVPGGLLLLDEVEWIHTGEPALATYLEVVAGLLQRRGHRLGPGPLLEALPDPPGLRRQASTVATLPVGVRAAATMFGLNLRVWGQDPQVRADQGDLPARLGAELAALAAAPDRDGITWGMRQVVYHRTGSLRGA